MPGLIGLRGRVMSEINVVPLVDVVLVLLIIFMITAPMLQMGVDVELPRTTLQHIPAQEERVIITLTKEMKVYINRYQIDLKELKGRLKAVMDRRMNREVFFRADRALPYGKVMKVLSQIQEAGVKRIGMVIEPLSSEAP